MPGRGMAAGYLTHVAVNHIAKEMTMKTALLSLLTALSLASLVVAGQPEPRANVGQADLAEAYVCPRSTELQLVPVSVALTTEGGPVLVNIVVVGYSWEGPIPVSLSVLFTVDGEPHYETEVTAGGTSFTLSPSRIFDVPAGAHRFGMSVICSPSSTGYPVLIYKAWLSAYELPLLKK
jgi:hypothetical protein